MLQNGGAYHGQSDGYAQNGDSASTVKERVLDGEYAGSAPDPHGSNQAAVHISHQNMQAVNSQYASTEQDSYEDEHEDTTSEGTR